MRSASDAFTVPQLTATKRKRRLVATTAYDLFTARAADAAGVDVVLVGDSASMVVAGNADTLPVTLDEMLFLSRCVARGTKRALLVGDMPFMSYQPSLERGVESAMRFLKEGGMSAVKVEGGEEVVPLVRALTSWGVPTMGHLGLLPQRVNAYGGYGVRGRGEEGERVMRAAEALCDAGVFSIVLEKVPATLAARVTESVPVPTIGIGAGPHCDGQVLVIHDLLGMLPGKPFPFVKRYAALHEEAVKALSAYREEVLAGKFPTEKHSF